MRRSDTRGEQKTLTSSLSNAWFMITSGGCSPSLPPGVFTAFAKLLTTRCFGRVDLGVRGVCGSCMFSLSGEPGSDAPVSIVNSVESARLPGRMPLNMIRCGRVVWRRSRRVTQVKGKSNQSGVPAATRFAFEHA